MRMSDLENDSLIGTRVKCLVVMVRNWDFYHKFMVAAIGFSWIKVV